MLIGNKRDEARLVLYRSFFALSYHAIAHPGKVSFVHCYFLLNLSWSRYGLAGKLAGICACWRNNRAGDRLDWSIRNVHPLSVLSDPMAPWHLCQSRLYQQPAQIRRSHL